VALPLKKAKGPERPPGMEPRKMVMAQARLEKLGQPRKVKSSKLGQELQNQILHADPLSGKGTPVPSGDQEF